MTEDVDKWTHVPARGQVLPSLSTRAYNNESSQHPHKGERRPSEEPWARSTTAPLLHWWDNTINHSVEKLVWWTETSVGRSWAFMEVAFISTHPSKAVHSCHSRRSLTLLLGNPFWSCQTVWEKGVGEKWFVCKLRGWKPALVPKCWRFLHSLMAWIRGSSQLQLTGSWIRRST